MINLFFIQMIKQGCAIGILALSVEIGFTHEFSDSTVPDIGYFPLAYSIVKFQKLVNLSSSFFGLFLILEINDFLFFAF